MQGWLYKDWWYLGQWDYSTMSETCIMNLPKSIGCTRVKPNVTALSVIMMCLYRFISYGVCTILRDDKDNDWDWASMWVEGFGELFVPSVLFSYEPKAGLK